MSSPNALWIFGYGSLIWRPAIPYDASRAGVVQGWARRFWQGSTDHRGVPGQPGRVVTLVPMANERVVGRAFRVPADRRDEVLAKLDHREQGGYERHDVTVEAWPCASASQSSGAIRALVYVATADNPEWLGPAPVDEMARTIATRRGPSGPNREYLLELERALEELGAGDPHVRELARRVRAIGH